MIIVSLQHCSNNNAVITCAIFSSVAETHLRALLLKRLREPILICKHLFENIYRKLVKGHDNKMQTFMGICDGIDAREKNSFFQEVLLMCNIQ